MQASDYQYTLLHIYFGHNIAKIMYTGTLKYKHIFDKKIVIFPSMNMTYGTFHQSLLSARGWCWEIHSTDTRMLSPLSGLQSLLSMQLLHRNLSGQARNWIEPNY